MPVQVHAEILVNQSVPRSEIDLEPTPHILEAPLLALSVHPFDMPVQVQIGHVVD